MGLGCFGGCAMAYFKTLGDGLLASLVGVTRQAIHKARKMDSQALLPHKTKATFDRAVRSKLNLRLPKGGDQKALLKASLFGYANRVKAVLATNLKKTHKVTDELAAACELAELLDVTYAPNMTLGQVMLAYLKGVASALQQWLTQNPQHDEALSDWTWGKLMLTERQLVTLRRYAIPSAKDLLLT